MANNYDILKTPGGGSVSGGFYKLETGQSSPGYVRPAVGQQWPMPNNPQASS